MPILDDLLRSHQELCKGMGLAISEIDRRQFGQRDSGKLQRLRHVLAKACALGAAVEALTMDEVVTRGDSYELTEKAWAETRRRELEHQGRA